MGPVFMATGPIFMFCAPGPVFGSTEGVGSRFNFLRVRTHFRQYRGRRVPFSCFSRLYSFSAETRALCIILMFCAPESFLAVPRASCPVFKVCAPGLIFGGTASIGSHFHVLRARTRFRRKRGCQVPFKCFALLKSYPVVLRASCPVFKFCAPGLVFGGSEGIDSYFHVLRVRTHFRRHLGHHVPFSCFARPDSFSAKTRVPGPVFMFYALGFIFGGTEGVGSHFHVLSARTHFRWKEGCRVPFSCFALLKSYPMVLRASCPVFKFCAPEIVFDGTAGVSSRF
jgi:hypothetical protein